MQIITEPTTAPPASVVIERTRELIPVLRARISETEQLRRLPDATVEDARAAGLFSLLLPAKLGGSGGGLEDYVTIVRLLAQADPTVAWTLGFLIEHNWMLARWPASVQEDVFTDHGSALMAAVANPPGHAVPTEGGYEVTGYWGYCSGVLNAEWVQVSATIEGAERPSLFLLPRDEVDVQDTWYMAGVQGSGSNDVKLEKRFVPAHRSVDINLWHSRRNHGAALYREPLYGYDARDLLVLIIPALLVGAAEAMLELYRERLDQRKAAYTPTPVGDTAPGQIRYARALAALRTAQVQLDAVVELTVTVNASSDDELSDELRALVKLDCLSICRQAWESVDLGIRGSGSAIYRSSDDTQHFLRDVQTILGHMTVDEDAMQGKAGEILLGRATEPDPARNFT